MRKNGNSNSNSNRATNHANRGRWTIALNLSNVTQLTPPERLK
jgi:hypothetical protein